MALRWDVVPEAERDHEAPTRPLLRATIGAGDLGLARPSVRVEHAPGRHLRLVARERVVLWARVKSYCEGVWLLAGASAPRLVEPITMAQVRAVKHAPDSERWLEAWARHFASALARSALAGPSAPGGSLLYPGAWQVAATEAKVREPRRSSADRDGLIDVHSARGPVFESWALMGSNATLTLRRPPSDDAARVKALRKLARARALPPLLLWLVSGLDLHVLLDGHERARAASLEGVPVARLVVTSTREHRWEPDLRMQEGELTRAEVALARASHPEGVRPSALDTIQRRLVGAFSEPRCTIPKTRAYAIPGGAEAWRREVAARLEALGEPVDHPMRTQP